MLMAMGELELAFLEADGADTRDALGRALELDMHEFARSYRRDRVGARSRTIHNAQPGTAQDSRRDGARR